MNLMNTNTFEMFMSNKENSKDGGRDRSEIDPNYFFHKIYERDQSDLPSKNEFSDKNATIQNEVDIKHRLETGFTPIKAY